LCDFVKLISRTLYKQGPYGGRPVVRHCLIITPGSLVKVSIVLLFFSLFCEICFRLAVMQLLFAAVENLTVDVITVILYRINVCFVWCVLWNVYQNWCKEFRKWLSSERVSVFAVSANNTVEVLYIYCKYSIFGFVLSCILSVVKLLVLWNCNF